MKKIVLFGLLCFVFCSCVNNKAEKYIKKAWSLQENGVDRWGYDKKVSEYFKKAQLINPQDWNSGYIQESQYLVGLYLTEKINKGEFLQLISELYGNFMKYSEINDQNKYSYAILKYLTLEEPENKSFIKMLYNPKYVYEDFSITNESLWNFIFGIILEEIEPKKFINTIYYNYIEISDDVLIELFFQVSGSK